LVYLNCSGVCPLPSIASSHAGTLCCYNIVGLLLFRSWSVIGFCKEMMRLRLGENIALSLQTPGFSRASAAIESTAQHQQVRRLVYPAFGGATTTSTSSG
jgi:hypothetical protein